MEDGVGASEGLVLTQASDDEKDKDSNVPERDEAAGGGSVGLDWREVSVFDEGFSAAAVSAVAAGSKQTVFIQRSYRRSTRIKQEASGRTGGSGWCWTHRDVPHRLSLQRWRTLAGDVHRVVQLVLSLQS